MKFKTIVIVHLIVVALAVLRLCFIPFDDHLRYGIGHIVNWTIVVSASCAFFYVPSTIPLRKWIKSYFGIYFFNSCFMAMYPYAIVVLYVIALTIPAGWRLMDAQNYFLQALIPNPVECETSTYIIRSWDDPMLIDNSAVFYVYKKGTFIERLIHERRAGGYEYENYHAKQILKVNEDQGILQVEVLVSPASAPDDSLRIEIQEWKIK